MYIFWNFNQDTTRCSEISSTEFNIVIDYCLLILTLQNFFERLIKSDQESYVSSNISAHDQYHIRTIEMMPSVTESGHTTEPEKYFDP